MNLSNQSADIVAVHEWLADDGTVLGCGTACELEHWKSQGVNADGDRLGNIIAHEPASEDARRRAAWAIAA